MLSPTPVMPTGAEADAEMRLKRRRKMTERHGDADAPVRRWRARLQAGMRLPDRRTYTMTGASDADGALRA